MSFVMWPGIITNANLVNVAFIPSGEGTVNADVKNGKNSQSSIIHPS